MSLIHAPSPSTAKQSFILFFFKGTAWGSRIQWVISLKALSIWIFLQRNFSSICHRLLFLMKGFQMKIIQLSKCINCKNMPSNRQINLKLQTEIGYYYKKKKSKRLHCRIIKQLQKCKVPINISEESVNEVKKKISFRISNTERLKLHKIQPLFACGWVLETI